MAFTSLKVFTGPVGVEGFDGLAGLDGLTGLVGLVGTVVLAVTLIFTVPLKRVLLSPAAVKGILTGPLKPALGTKDTRSRVRALPELVMLYQTLPLVTAVPTLVEVRP